MGLKLGAVVGGGEYWVLGRGAVVGGGQHRIRGGARSSGMVSIVSEAKRGRRGWSVLDQGRGAVID